MPEHVISMKTSLARRIRVIFWRTGWPSTGKADDLNVTCDTMTSYLQVNLLIVESQLMPFVLLELNIVKAYISSLYIYPSLSYGAFHSASSALTMNAV